MCALQSRLSMKPAFVLVFAILLTILTACEIEGGVTPESSLEALPLPSVAVEQQSPVAQSEVGIRIGLLEEPDDLLPFHDDVADQRASAPITELLFPSPLLELNYAYTTTGVLERIPSLENGDVDLLSTDVYLDATGMITTTETEVVTQMEQIAVTYRWNPDLVWSDGTPVTADDSVFAYELSREAAFGGDVTSRLALIERYEKIDAHTTRAVLYPDYTDPAYIKTFWTPLPRHLLQDEDPLTISQSDFAMQPVGYGPYMIERREEGGVRLARNPYYPDPQPSFAMVTFVFAPGVDAMRAVMLKGGLDLAVADQVMPEQIEFLERDRRNGLIDVAYVPSPIWEHLDFNLDVPLLQDIRVRRAIAYAVDRQGMADELFAGRTPVLDSWILSDQWASAPPDQITRYEYAPERAHELLDEAGFIDGDGDGIREWEGMPLQLRLLTTEGSPIRIAVAEHIQADIRSVGIDVIIDAIPAQDLYLLDGPLFRRDFEMVLFAWIAGADPRGWELWSCAGVPGQLNNWTGNNFPGWCFYEADQSIRVATTSMDHDERKAAYLRQQQLFTQELPSLPLFQRLSIIMNGSALHDLEPDPSAPITWNIVEWSQSR